MKARTIPAITPNLIIRRNHDRGVVRGVGPGFAKSGFAGFLRQVAVIPDLLSRSGAVEDVGAAADFPPVFEMLRRFTNGRSFLNCGF